MKMSDINYEDLSPMMKQYYDIKSNYQDTLLFYRLGDFYELFFEDASIASRILGLTLTGKNAGLKERVPMCGVPHHSSKTYIKEALSKGYKVAICEQTEDPKNAKGMVKREVTEVISKGTMTDLEYLDNKDFNYLGSILEYPSSYVVTYADISTAELNIVSIEKNINALINIVINNNFKELVVDDSFSIENINLFKNIYNIDITIDSGLIEDNSLLKDVQDPKMKKGLRHLLYYLNVRELKDISHFNKVNIIDTDEYLSMDIHTIRNLELFETLRLKERQNSLLWLIDKCKTSMGSRKLRRWMLKPLRDKTKICDRYDKIDVLNKNFIERSELANLLYEIYDIERLCGKVNCGSANARDLLQLCNSLKVLPDIKRIIKSIGFSYEIEEFTDLYNLITNAINTEAPITLRDGGLIKDGYNSELDELKVIRKGGKNFIASIEKDAQEKTGISNLRVGYNKVFGYFIEVTKGNVDKIKPELGWERKQTLVNAERYISPELKEKEDLILNAEEKIIELEYQLFIDIRLKVKNCIHELNKMADTISEIDALVSLSLASEDLKLVRPSLNDNHIIEVIDGRHPVVEHVSKIEYVPNDVIMDENTTTLLITGPNMSGKSTYMRELAIIVILAQMGSFVPAKSASLPIFDKIFTRIGASDDLVSGDSTFMIEMKEANNAIENATKDSLILFDELGRGTSTYDGMSIAQSVLEYITNKIRCKTLFSTHYHELTTMEKDNTGIKNVHVGAEEHDGNIVFLHKVKDGFADKSYGIHVAKLSGMPDEIIKRANEILTVYENKEKPIIKEQISFDFNESNFSKIEEYLKAVDIDTITPREAMDMLYVLKDMMK